MMLKQILSTFEQVPGPVSLDLLALQLNLDRAALEGMLAELVNMGRLEKIDNRAGVSCAACGVKKRCPYVLSVQASTYALPDRFASEAACQV